jgi:hypothetical protein
MLKQDGDRPGKNALTYINYSFPQIYAISLAWAKLGSHVVRYEDLLVDPLLQLREVTSKIVPLDEERLKAAVFLCKPEQLTRVIDPRFLSICLRSKAPRVVNYPKESGYRFKPSSEQIDIPVEEYGQMVVTPDFVEKQIATTDGVSLLEKRLSYWWGHQDLYILRRVD